MAVTTNPQPEHVEKFFATLNRVVIIFHDDKTTIDILRRLLDEPKKEQELYPKLLAAMPNYIGLKYVPDNDDLILRPFQPSRK